MNLRMLCYVVVCNSQTYNNNNNLFLNKLKKCILRFIKYNVFNVF